MQSSRCYLPATMAAGALLVAAAATTTARAQGYIQTNLVANRTGLGAPTIDANLVNPWGLSASATSPWWNSDNGAGVTTIINGAGVPSALVVTIPPPASSPGGTVSAPTGQVSNATTDFGVSAGNTNPARFIFVTENGTVSGWNPTASSTSAITMVDRSSLGAVYKGLALANNGAGNFLYAADFANGRIDVFNNTYALTSLTGSFTDPGGVAGYSPFNIWNIGGQLYVAYAAQDPASHPDELHGAGLGYVDVYSTNGVFVKRLVTGSGIAGGANTSINAPWGLALAPSNFGVFSNAVLVGNFGSGTIMGFNPTTNAFLGVLTDTLGSPLTIDGLWGIGFGNGTGSGATNALYFNAGPNGETDGVFGRITAVGAPEPGTLALLALGILAPAGRIARRRATAAA